MGGRRLQIAAWVVCGALLAGYTALGLYSVESDESAVAFVFGRAVGRDVLPGIHWNPPWPFGRVVVAKTATNFVMPIGYRMVPGASRETISDLWLTGDTNIVNARLNVQFSITSLSQFLISHEDPRELLRQAGERMLTRFLISEGVDGVLAGRRAALREAVARGVQELLDAEGAGITVQSVTIEELAPPRQGQVRDAFQDVQNSRADRERAALEARAYRGQVLAEAEGEAERLLSEARGERHRRIELARGEVARFKALAGEHARAPRVTEQRLYLETLERLLPGLETYVVDSGDDGTVNLRVLR
jgi:membrane protease subunit HflK